MNRKQRRKAVKQGITDKDLKIMRQQIREEAGNEAVRYMKLATVLVLRDKLGFGKKRIQRFIHDLNEVGDAICEDYLDFEDIAKTIKDECDITI